MQTEIIDKPFRVTLIGCGGAIGSDCIGATGKRHMDNMWREVREKGIKTMGINHWVYLPNSMIFTGVELADKTVQHGALEKLDVSLDRYFRYVHTGEYSALAQIWPLLFRQLKDRHEIPNFPHLEIYGHWNAEPSKCETTILISLEQRQ